MLYFIQACSVSTHVAGPHQPTLIYRGDSLAYQPVAASGLALANTRYNPVQASGYHLSPQLPGTTSASSLQHLAHIPTQSYYIGASTPPSAATQHQPSYQSRHPGIQGLTYGQVVATGSPQAGYIPGTTTTSNSLTSYNVGYGHLTTTSSYSSQSSGGGMNSLSVAGPPSYETTPPDTFSTPHGQTSTPNRPWSSQTYQ